MNNIDLRKLLITMIVIFSIQIISHLIKRIAKQTQQKFNIRKSRYFAIKRVITSVSLLLSLVALLFIWNVNVKNAWITLTGILTLVAVAFFAVWSLVGNILAGFIIYFTSPFKIEDTIEIMPDKIKGKVLAINTFYTVLYDEDKNYISIPNSLCFQKYIKVIKNKNNDVVDNFSEEGENTNINIHDEK